MSCDGPLGSRVTFVSSNLWLCFRRAARFPAMGLEHLFRRIAAESELSNTAKYSPLAVQAK
jgi:hypothetical protein